MWCHLFRHLRKSYLTQRQINQLVHYMWSSSKVEVKYSRHSNLVNWYGMSESQITTYMFHLLLLLSCMTYHQILNMHDAMDANSGAETAYHSEAYGFHFRFFIFRVVICGSLFVISSYLLWSLYCRFLDLWLLLTRWYSQTLLAK